MYIIDPLISITQTNPFSAPRNNDISQSVTYPGKETCIPLLHNTDQYRPCTAIYKIGLGLYRQS